MLWSSCWIITHRSDLDTSLNQLSLEWDTSCQKLVWNTPEKPVVVRNIQQKRSKFHHVMVFPRLPHICAEMYVPETLGFSSTSPTLSFFFDSGTWYTRLRAFTNMEVLESKNSHPGEMEKTTLCTPFLPLLTEWSSASQLHNLTWIAAKVFLAGTQGLEQIEESDAVVLREVEQQGS